MITSFPGVISLECHGGHAKYQIPTTTTTSTGTTGTATTTSTTSKQSLAYIFTQIEAHKKQYGITHYSVGQTSVRSGNNTMICDDMTGSINMTWEYYDDCCEWHCHVLICIYIMIYCFVYHVLFLF